MHLAMKHMFLCDSGVFGTTWNTGSVCDPQSFSVWSSAFICNHLLSVQVHDAYTVKKKNSWENKRLRQPASADLNLHNKSKWNHNRD